MTQFIFRTAGEIRFGRGEAIGAAKAAAGLGRDVVLCQGGSPGRADWLADALVQAGCTVTRISCAEEPTLEVLEQSVAAARGAGAQSVVALGGGSVLDLGKAVAALVPAPGAPLDHLEVVGKGLPLTAAPLPMIALPTTAGTGSEVTRNAVIGVPEARRKVSLRDPRMLPDIAIVDPALTDGTPRAVTLASGLDAVVQVIEPYLSSRANPMTDALCRAAIPVGLQAIRRLTEAEDPAARDGMAWVSLCGGLALANAGLGAVHGLSGVLGGMTGAAHGAICGTLLPHVLVANRAAPDLAPAVAERFDWVSDEIARVFGGAPAGAPARLEAWMADAGLPRLAAMGLSEPDITPAAQAAQGASSMKANPVALDAATLEAVLRSAL